MSLRYDLESAEDWDRLQAKAFYDIAAEIRNMSKDGRPGVISSQAVVPRPAVKAPAFIQQSARHNFQQWQQIQNTNGAITRNSHSINKSKVVPNQQEVVKLGINEYQLRQYVNFGQMPLQAVYVDTSRSVGKKGDVQPQAGSNTTNVCAVNKSCENAAQDESGSVKTRCQSSAQAMSRSKLITNRRKPAEVRSRSVHALTISSDEGASDRALGDIPIGRKRPASDSTGGSTVLVGAAPRCSLDCILPRKMKAERNSPPAEDTALTLLNPSQAANDDDNNLGQSKTVTTSNVPGPWVDPSAPPTESGEEVSHLVSEPVREDSGSGPGVNGITVRSAASLSATVLNGESSAITGGGAGEGADLDEMTGRTRRNCSFSQRYLDYMSNIRARRHNDLSNETHRRERPTATAPPVAGNSSQRDKAHDHSIDGTFWKNFDPKLRFRRDGMHHIEQHHLPSEPVFVNISQERFDLTRGLPGNIESWNLIQVRDYLREEFSEEIAREFLHHGIDGYALTVLRLEHIIEHLSIPLGPAISIVNKVGKIKTMEHIFKMHNEKCQKCHKDNTIVL